MAGSRSTAARVTLGAISLSNSSHFALKPYSNIIKPVALPGLSLGIVGSSGGEHADAPHSLGLLRPRRERPRRRAAYKRHEIASVHSSTSPPCHRSWIEAGRYQRLPTGTGKHTPVRGETAPVRHFHPAYSRFSSPCPPPPRPPKWTAPE